MVMAAPEYHLLGAVEVAGHHADDAAAVHQYRTDVAAIEDADLGDFAAMIAKQAVGHGGFIP